MKIEKAREVHIPQMIDLLKDIGNLHHQGRGDIFREGIIKYHGEEIRAFLEDENNPVFVVLAEDGITVLAYAFCNIIIKENSKMFEDRTILFVDDFCVNHLYRGENIGGRLMDFMKNYAEEIQADSIELNVWNFNEAAINFYQKQGFSTQKIQMELNMRLENE